MLETVNLPSRLTADAAGPEPELLPPTSDREVLARRLHSTFEHLDPTLDGSDDWDELDEGERALYLAVAERLLAFYVLKRPTTTV